MPSTQPLLNAAKAFWVHRITAPDVTTYLSKYMPKIAVKRYVPLSVFSRLCGLSPKKPKYTPKKGYKLIYSLA